jgi:chloride channel protein, CIC family
MASDRRMLCDQSSRARGCGFFVPFLAVGDLSGRMFAPVLGVSGSLAGAAGAAGGIAGGYRLPVTATAMVLGVGGPFPAVLTCIGTIAVATVTGAAVVVAVDRLASARARALESS